MPCKNSIQTPNNSLRSSFDSADFGSDGNKSNILPIYYSEKTQPIEPMQILKDGSNRHIFSTSTIKEYDMALTYNIKRSERLSLQSEEIRTSSLENNMSDTTFEKINYAPRLTTTWHASTNVEAPAYFSKNDTNRILTINVQNNKITPKVSPTALELKSSKEDILSDEDRKIENQTCSRVESIQRRLQHCG